MKRFTRSQLAAGAVAAGIVLVAFAAAVSGTAQRPVAVLVAAGALATVVGVSFWLTPEVLVEDRRVGRRTRRGERWCELDDVVLTTVGQHADAIAGVDSFVVLWCGSTLRPERNPSSLLSFSAADVERIRDAERAAGGLAAFLVPLDALSAADAAQLVGQSNASR